MNNGTEENAYENLRSAALSKTTETLGLDLPKDNVTVYGIVVEWEYEEVIVTLAAFLTGEASIYFSNGGGFVGGIEVPEINKTAKKFVGEAQNYLRFAKKSDDLSLPEDLDVKFYFLTNDGMYIAEDSMENMESELLPLYEEGNKVITEYQINKKKKEKVH